MAKNEGNGHLFQKFFTTNKDEKGKRSSPLYYLAIIICVGIVLMLFSNFLSSRNSGESVPVFNDQTKESNEDVAAFSRKSDADGPVTMQDYEYGYEKQLEAALEQIIGVSDVSVMINLAETETKVFERNKSTKEQKTDETDREGGKRNVLDVTRDDEVVIVRTGDKEEPLIARTEKPAIRGVLVVARGVENIQVKTWVIEAVSRVLDVPTHRVSVLPKKSREE